MGGVSQDILNADVILLNNNNNNESHCNSLIKYFQDQFCDHSKSDICVSVCELYRIDNDNDNDNMEREDADVCVFSRVVIKEYRLHKLVLGQADYFRNVFYQYKNSFRDTSSDMESVDLVVPCADWESNGVVQLVFWMFYIEDLSALSKKMELCCCEVHYLCTYLGFDRGVRFVEYLMRDMVGSNGCPPQKILDIMLYYGNSDLVDSRGIFGLCVRWAKTFFLAQNHLEKSAVSGFSEELFESLYMAEDCMCQTNSMELFSFYFKESHPSYASIPYPDPPPPTTTEVEVEVDQDRIKIQHFFERDPDWKAKPNCKQRGKYGPISRFIMGGGEEVSDLKWSCYLCYEHDKGEYAVALIADSLKGGRVRNCTIDVDIYVIGKGKTLKTEYRNEYVECGSKGRRKDFTDSEMGPTLDDCFLTPRGGKFISAIIVDIKVVQKFSSDTEMSRRLSG